MVYAYITISTILTIVTPQNETHYFMQRDVILMICTYQTSS